MKDKKELLETKLELNDQQLENVEGGWSSRLMGHYYCNECGWKSRTTFMRAAQELSKEHRIQTGHTDIVPVLEGLD